MSSVVLQRFHTHVVPHRGARVYRLLDPERRWTGRLTRTEVRFHDED